MPDEPMKHVLYQGKYIKVVSANNWEYVERGSTGSLTEVVTVLPTFMKQGTLMTRLVSQFRIPVNRQVLALVAGLVDPGEERRNAAHRELKEEAGLLHNGVSHYVGEFPASSGLTSETSHLYIVPQCIPISDPSWRPDQEEGIEVHEMPLDNVINYLTHWQSVTHGLVDSKIYAAVEIYNRLWNTKTMR